MPVHAPGYWITSFRAEVVDSSGKSTPLSEVYNHHWLVFDKVNNGGMCGGIGQPRVNLGYVFGVGAESRNTATAFPPG